MKNFTIECMTRDLANVMEFIESARQHIDAGEYRAAASALSTATNYMFNATIEQARLGWEQSEALDYKAIATQVAETADKGE